MTCYDKDERGEGKDRGLGNFFFAGHEVRERTAVWEFFLVGHEVRGSTADRKDFYMQASWNRMANTRECCARYNRMCFKVSTSRFFTRLLDRLSC